MGEEEWTPRHELKQANFITFASVYSSLNARKEVCSYELHICSVKKKTRVQY